ncbi:hypothetical protein G9A89_017007 [Geosiphon pyriformis]|nr:hypothetical protein G9A89_017007 [Geosiphon pyriformis]
MEVWSFLHSSSDLSNVAAKRQAQAASTVCYHIEGFLNCSYLNAAIKLGESLTKDQAVKPVSDNQIGLANSSTQKNQSNARKVAKVEVAVYEKEKWEERVKILHSLIQGTTESHTTSPLIYEGCNVQKFKFIGGFHDFVELARNRHGLDDQQNILTGFNNRECSSEICELKKPES